VNTGRARTIADDVMQGQSFTATESLASGLIDTISDYGTALSDAGKLGRMEKQNKEGKK